MKGAQQSGSTTTTQAPPSYMLPYISTALGYANNLQGSQGPQYYPGQQVAGFNPLQNQAFSGIRSLAGRNPYRAATDFNNSLLTGNFSGPEVQLQQMGMGNNTNPYLDQMYQQGAGQIENSLTSQFAGAGRNVEASQPMEGKALGDFANNLYGGAYENDQNRALAANQLLAGMQQNAVGNAQNLTNSKLGLQGALMGAGNQIQGLSQQQIDANMAKYNYYQQLPYQMLQQYEQFLGGVQPGSQQSNPYFTNPMANALGTGLAGMQLYGMGKNYGWWGGPSSLGGSAGSSIGGGIG